MEAEAFIPNKEGDTFGVQPMEREDVELGLLSVLKQERKERSSRSETTVPN
jgi:hypothetical protein